ncbi:MAG: S53 family peptidase [Dermatophilaceae bacterium]
MPFATAPQTIRVYLAPKGGLDNLKAAVAAVSDPSSASYRHFISSDQFDATYAPSQAQVEQVSNYLTGTGLSVSGVEGHRRYVEASGTPAQLSSAFEVVMGGYTHDAQTVTAPDRAASMPNDVAANVLTVTGLDTTTVTMTPDHIGPDGKTDRGASPNAKPPAGFVNARPCSLWYGQVEAQFQADFVTPLPEFKNHTLPYAPCGYTGPQFRAAYENNSALNGARVTVAITGAYARRGIADDANTYAVNHGDGPYTPGQLTQNVPGSFTHQGPCDPSGWSREETLDVEAVHAMAPQAQIRYYGATSCFDQDLVESLQRAVDENVAQLVTNSWGEIGEAVPASSVVASEQVFLQGALQGQSFLFSSGDNGDELQATGLKQADYPASDPYVTAVGGTSTGIDQTGALALQTGWGTRKYTLSGNGESWAPLGFLYGAGGGYSALFNRPAYQNGTVGSPYRGVPDVAMDGDPNTGMLIGQTQTFPDGVRYGEYRIGGTSLSSPLLAGMGALAVQQARSRLGFLNPILYAAPASTISDVRPSLDLGVVCADYVNGVDAAGGLAYSVRTFDQDSSLTTKQGWDTVTGLGVPSPRFFAFISSP